MKIQEHYASLGANYHTLRSIKARQMFDTLEDAYEFWKVQQDKKEKLKQLAETLGANYSTIRSIKARRMFDTLEDAYEFWKVQQDKKEKLKQLAETLGIKVESVKQRGNRRGYYKVDDTLLETKWKNIFEFEGERLALWRQCKKHNVNERTVTRHYNKHGDWSAAMNHARSVRVIIALNSVAAQCERLGLNYKRVESCAYRKKISKQAAIDFCLKLDGRL